MKNIRVKEAAEYLGVSKSMLDKLRCFGGGPRYFKLGRAVVYSLPDLDAWRDERVRSNTWSAANQNNLATDRVV
nr:helix-turn-helix domain-containing protein [Neorhizobium alkalisoli]